MRAGGVSALLAALALVTAGPIAAQPEEPPPARVDYAAERAAIGRYQDADQRLQDVGWQLARANADFCPQLVPSIGLQLQDMASYGAPDIARAALGLTGDFAVETAARGSPAALVGAFTRNREIIGLEGFDPNQWPAERAPIDWQRTVRAHDHVEAVLTRNGGIAITFADGETVRVQPVPVCATRFEALNESDTAVADGARVVIGVLSPTLADQEAVFAGTVAHELAHNVLGHDAWLDRNGRKPRYVRRIEREADRLIPWLFANAGYDPQDAVTYMIRWGSKNDAGLRLRRNHDGWDERAEMIAAEVPLVQAVLAREGKADWASHFRREIDPQGGLARPASR